MVSTVLDNLAAGEPPDSVATAYRITKQQVRAARLYAAELAKERILHRTSATTEQAGSL